MNGLREVEPYSPNSFLSALPRVFIALFLVLFATACDEFVTAPPELTHVTIAVPGQTNVIFLPISIMEVRGYFAAEGIDVTIMNVASGADARNALANGSADVMMGFYEHVLVLRASQNTDAVAFALIGDAPGVAIGTRPALSATVKTAKDLVGRKIGISSPSSGSHNLVRYLLRKENIAESAVTFVSVGLGDPAEAALESGQVDVLASIDPAITDLQQRNGIQLLTDTRTKAGTSAVYGGDYAGVAFSARRTFIESYPVTTQRLANAAAKALAWMAASTPEQIAAALPDSYVGGQRALYVHMLENSVGMFTHDAHFDEAALTRVIQTFGLFDAAVASANLSVGSTYTNTFAARAK